MLFTGGQAIGAPHRHVFGVLACFALLPDPNGAVLYRAAALFVLLWGQRSDADGGRFGLFSPRAFALITWLPLRVTARFFVIVGDFEKAI